MNSESSQIAAVTQNIGDLRLESTNQNSESLTVNETNDTKYSKLFSTFYFNYEINKNNTLNISLNSRISRPRYSDVNPYVFTVLILWNILQATL